jgi:hypothetical protein
MRTLNQKTCGKPGNNAVNWRFEWPRRMLFCLCTCCVWHPVVLAQASQLGSTATLDWLRNPNQQTVDNAEPKPVRPLSDMIGSLAAQPSPAFRYRLWPAKTQLKPGSAQTHFYRAAVERYSIVSRLTVEQNTALNQLMGEDIQTLSTDAAREWVERFAPVYEELEAMSRAEDLDWDLRIRDLRGQDIWGVRLEDVQQARSLARLLTMKIRTQIDDKDFEGATASMRVGFRMAALVGHGESLVQTLVGLAIENMMYAAVDYAIRSPDCPNLYWALRSLPEPLMPIAESAEIELAMVLKTIPIFEESEIIGLSDKELTKRLSKSMKELKQLMGRETEFGPAEVVGITLSLSGDRARQRLLKSGYDAKQLDALTPLQASLIDAGRELRAQSDELLKGLKIAGHEGNALRKQVQENFEAWLVNERGSAASMVGSLLFPGTQSIYGATARTEMLRNRLMVAEAVRHYAATHGGQLPMSLEQIVDTPLPNDPFNGKAFSYRKETRPKGQFVTLLASEEGGWRTTEILESQYSFPRAPANPPAPANP